MVFKGRHSRKFLLTRGVQARRRVDPIFRYFAGRTRENGEKKGITSKREGLEEIRSPLSLLQPRVLRAFPPFRGSSRRFRRDTGFLLVSAVTRSSFFPPAIFLSSRDHVRLHAVCRINREGTHEGRGRRRWKIVAAMKRTSGPTLYRY